MNSLNEDLDENFPSYRLTKWAVITLLVYFGLRLGYFAASISPFVPPDEVTHFGISQIFANVFFLPENSPQSYQFGLVTNIPWLYYLVMGKLLHLNFFGVSDLVFLRLLNIPLAFGTVYYTWKLLRLFTDDRLTHILLIVAMTNTLMFSFLSASVSYDNAANLLAIMALYYLFAFFRLRSDTTLAASLLCQLIGMLTKKTLLPLFLVMDVILVIHESRRLGGLPAGLRAWMSPAGAQRLALLISILVCLGLNLHLYGGNYLRYGTIDPPMSMVVKQENAMQYRLEARNTIFLQFRDGKISEEQAVEMAMKINHPVDRDHTIYLIQNYAAQKQNGMHLLGRGRYIPVWVTSMLPGIYGIYGHLSMPNYGPTMMLAPLLVILSGTGFLLRWRPDREKDGWQPLLITIIAAFYVFFLMYYVTYPIYLVFADAGVALQGRYAFPVIGAIYVLSSIYLMRLFKGRVARLIVFGAAVIIFITSDFPFFLGHATPEWFSGPQG